jgi:hypothetical protein
VREHLAAHPVHLQRHGLRPGQAWRIRLRGSQPTCELYLDTYDVHADDYTCKAEKDHWGDLAASCGQSDEDPFPHGNHEDGWVDVEGETEGEVPWYTEELLWSCDDPAGGIDSPDGVRF